MSTLNQKSKKVGCDGPDGLLRVHPENETCDVCGSAVSDEDVDVAMRAAIEADAGVAEVFGEVKSAEDILLCSSLKRSIRAALEADRKRRAVQHVSGEPAAWMHPASIERLKAYRDGDADGFSHAYAFASPGNDVDIALYAGPPAAQAVPNDDTGHEWATRHHLFIYEVDFGEEGKGRYIRLSDFNKVCEKLEHAANEWADAATNGLQYLKNVRDGLSSFDSAIEGLTRNIEHARSEQPRAAQAVPEGMCLVTKEDGNNYCLILTALGMEEEGDPVAEVKRLAAVDAAAKAVPDREKLLNMLMEANGLLRSCFQVAERMAVQFGAENGANWNALHGQLDNLLKAQHLALREEFERRAAAPSGEVE